MKLLKLVLGVGLVAFAHSSMAQEKVDSKGLSAKVKLEEAVWGYLTDLNGKYKLRATEVTIAPGGYVGPHHHMGPGIRYVVSGQLTFVQAGKAVTYKAGDFFSESGDVVHTGHNKTGAPVRIVFFEVLPADWAGGSSFVPSKLR
jgi:quercetin dioxygenase-like cupin family protein